MTPKGLRNWWLSLIGYYVVMGGLLIGGSAYFATCEGVVALAGILVLLGDSFGLGWFARGIHGKKRR